MNAETGVPSTCATALIVWQDSIGIHDWTSGHGLDGMEAPVWPEAMCGLLSNMGIVTCPPTHAFHIFSAHAHRMLSIVSTSKRTSHKFTSLCG